MHEKTNGKKKKMTASEVVQHNNRELAKMRRELDALKHANPANQVGVLPRRDKNIPRNVELPKKSKKMQKAALKRMIAPDRLVDPKVKGWLKLVRRPWDASEEINGEAVKIPTNSDLIPCKTTVVKNYGSKTYVVASGSEYRAFWFYPEGGYVEDGGPEPPMWTSANVSLNSGGTIVSLGPNLSNDATGNQTGTLGQYPTVGVVASGSSEFGSGDNVINKALNGTGAAECFPVQLDGLETPLELVGQAYAGQCPKFRNIAFGVKISYTGDLSSCSGWVDFYQLLSSPSREDDWTSLKRSPGYERKYFGDSRTHYMWFYPDCHTPDWRQTANMAAATTTFPGCRLLMQLHGDVGDEFVLELISYQEWESEKLLSVSTPGYQTAQVAPLNNAIVTAHDSGSKDIYNDVAKHVTAGSSFLSGVSSVLEKGIGIAETVGGIAALL